MTYGLRIINPEGELVIDSEAFGLYCIGRGVLQGSVVPPTGTATGGSPGRRSGFSIYRITWSGGPIVVVFDLPLGKRVGIISVTPGSGFFDVKMHCGDTPDAFDIDSIEYPIDIWGYAVAAHSPAGAYGLALFNSAGVQTWDFSQGLPLWPRGYIAGPPDTYNIPSLFRPVAVGPPTTDWTVATLTAVKHYKVEHFRGAFRRTSGSIVAHTLFIEQRYELSNVDAPDVGEGDLYPCSSFILEGNLLP
jgi:hypothetical protein